MAETYPDVAEIFRTQWNEARGSHERADCIERAQLTLAFWETHEWDGIRWINKSPQGLLRP